jgi:hypothetical protein
MGGRSGGRLCEHIGNGVFNLSGLWDKIEILFEELDTVCCKSVRTASDVEGDDLGRVYMGKDPAAVASLVGEAFEINVRRYVTILIVDREGADVVLPRPGDLGVGAGVVKRRKDLLDLAVGWDAVGEVSGDISTVSNFGDFDDGDVATDFPETRPSRGLELVYVKRVAFGLVADGDEDLFGGEVNPTKDGVVWDDEVRTAKEEAP